MKINLCRNCKSSKLTRVFSLGNIFYTGKFLKKNLFPRRGPIDVTMCKKCTLVQLEDNFDLKYLYGPDYGYRTGINLTMRNHVKNVVNDASKLTNLNNGDYVLDIASNDGTLLNFYDKKIITCGIDPILKKYIKNYKNINFKIPEFFSAKKVNGLVKKKFKIITALSVFYDQKDPNRFLKDVEKLLEINGVLILEFADLASIIKYNVFDTFCHEHLEYYSVKVINEMCSKNQLKVFDIKSNNINGGSLQFYVCKNKSNFKKNYNSINKFIKRDKKYKLSKKKHISNLLIELRILKIS